MDDPDQFLILLLDNLEVFRATGLTNGGTMEDVTLIAEKYDTDKITIYQIHENFIADEEDIALKDPIDVVYGIKKYLDKNYSEKSFNKLPILDKLKLISKISTITFVIRDLKETRGGEYIELVYLLYNGLMPNQIYMLKLEPLDLSEMAWEILDNYNINMRTYKSENVLCSEATRIVNNHIQRLS
jgi:hypothetical protein